MNIDIQNYRKFRLISHGGRSFHLFNRQQDKVYTISQTDYVTIIRSHNREAACAACEKAYAVRIVP